MQNEKPVTVAITGASGSIYGIRLVETLLKSNKKVNLLITEAAFLVINEETGLNWRGDKNRVNELIREHFKAGEELIYYDNSNFYSPLASGSSGKGTMIICPCSMGTLGRIAGGICSGVHHRSRSGVVGAVSLAGGAGVFQ